VSANKLFENRAGIGADEIVLYVVPRIEPSNFAGCARHPDGKPGAVVISNVYELNAWNAAHETGHLLGLRHPCEKPYTFPCLQTYGERLMLPDLYPVTKPVPQIGSDEKVTMYSSPLTI
jgi:hypothetical protein